MKTIKRFTEVPRSRWPSGHDEPKRIQVWQSTDFLVQVFAEPGVVIRLSVNRIKRDPRGMWRDRIEWEELQAIKAAIGFGNHYAVEVYPRDRDVVNVANFRHLWVLPEPLDIGWSSMSTTPTARTDICIDACQNNQDIVLEMQIKYCIQMAATFANEGESELAREFMHQATELIKSRPPAYCLAMMVPDSLSQAAPA